MDDKEQSYIVRYIPYNYSTGINVAGYNFRIRQFVEGIALGVTLAVITYLVMHQFDAIPNGTKVGTVIMVAFFGFIVGVYGINDEPITEFVSNMMKFKRNKRAAYYDPIIRDESLPYVIERKDRYDKSVTAKVAKAYESYKNYVERKDIENLKEFQRLNTFEHNTLYFGADEGKKEKPLEYYNYFELKKYKKELRKAEKKRIKMAKLEAKKQMKELKRQNKLNKRKGI